MLVGSGTGHRIRTCLLALTCAGIAASTSTLTAAADSGWTFASAPSNPEVERGLFSIDCPDATHCWAVGQTWPIKCPPPVPDSACPPTGPVQPLIERYDGQSWTVAPAPKFGSEVIGDLNGITCAGARDCWAVGSATFDPSLPNQLQPLMEHYDGVTWALADRATSGPNQGIVAMACTNADSCWGVGDFQTTRGGAMLLEKYDGRNWGTTVAPDISADTTSLDAVSCVAAADCWAVGSQAKLRITGDASSEASCPVCAVRATSISPYGPTHALAAHYDGTTWQAASPPDSAGSKGGSLTSVACPAHDVRTTV